MIQEIIDAGLDDAIFGPNVGGYYIQQDPKEFAGLVQTLQGYDIKTYLSIGTAGGGAERFLFDKLRFEKFYSIDLNEHPRRKIWHEQNKTAICEVQEFLGDSHSEDAEKFLSDLNIKFDCIGIDGDHTPCGVRLDWALVQPYLKKGTIVWFHDIAECQGPLELWEMLSSKFEVLYDNRDKYGIGCLKI
jgi:predicted O-methyltransferase YrrM